MNFAETVSFIAQSLSLYDSDQNLEDVKNLITKQEIDWEAVVKVSTQHYVLPALYANLNEFDLIPLLPDDLVAYMEHISQLNTERNDQIIIQCLEINELFQKNDLEPVFLKGTGLLLGQEDIKHYRMLADIDILLPNNQNDQAFNLLQENGYFTNKKTTDIPTERHRPRLVHEDFIAAVEIHSEALRRPFNTYLNGNDVWRRRFRESDINIPHLNDQLALAVAASQINDFGYDRRTISLKTMNDVLILKSQGAQLVTVDNSLGKILSHYMNFVSEMCLIHSSDHPDADTQVYLEEMQRMLNDEKYREKQSSSVQKELYLKTRLGIIPKAIRSKEYRKWLWERLKVLNRTK